MAWARRGEAHHGVEERRTTTREWRDEEGQCLPEELAEGHLPDEEEGGVSTRMHMGEADLVPPLVAIRASCPCLMMDGGDSLVPRALGVRRRVPAAELGSCCAHGGTGTFWALWRRTQAERESMCIRSSLETDFAGLLGRTKPEKWRSTVSAEHGAMGK